MSDKIHGKAQDMWFRKMNFWQRFLHLATFGLVFSKPPRYKTVMTSEPGSDTVAVGSGPGRTVHQRIVFDFEPGAMRRAFTAFGAFMGRRDVQLALRLPIVPVFIYLIYWGWVMYSGGAVSDASFYTLPHGSEQPLLTVSRLSDVPALFVYFAIAVTLVRGCENLYYRLDKEVYLSEAYSIGWWAMSGCAIFLGVAIVALFAYGTNNEGVVITGAAITMCNTSFAAAIYGAVWGVVAVFWREAFGKKLLLASLTFAVVMLAWAVPLGIGEGWVVGLLAASTWFAVCTAALVVTALVGYLFVGAVIALFKSKSWRPVGRGFAVVGKWFIATDAAKQD